MYIYIYISKCIYVYVCVCMWVCMDVCMHACVNLRALVRACAYMHVVRGTLQLTYAVKQLPNYC